MELDLTGLATLVPGQHAVDSWNLTGAALDPAATVAPAAISLLIDALGPIAARSGKPSKRPLAVRVTTSDPAREFTIEATDTVRLEPAEPDGSVPHLRLPSEALVRLVYGRLIPPTPRRSKPASLTLMKCGRSSPASEPKRQPKTATENGN